MRKNKQTWSVKTLVFLALLVAIQLVLSRVLVIDLGVYRITLGTIATVLAGLWMGACCRRCRRRRGRHHRMFHERLWRESSDHFICNHLGRSCRSSRQADG